jgi:diguanylate cyclase (GGDEF)-like protein
MISASLEQRKIFEIIRSYLARELKTGYSATYSLHDGETVRLDDPQNSAPNSERLPERPQDRAMQEVLEIALHATNPLPAMIKSGETFRFIERGQLTPGLFVFRFRCASDTDYFCVCLSPEKPAAMESFESRLRMLFAQIETTGKNIQRYLGVQNLVYLDDATGLYNTRYLGFILDREIAQARATHLSFAVLFMDLDQFKGVNDTHGHLVGTRLLHEMGIQLRKFVREKDTVFRYGGDEFVAVLSPCDLSTAKAVAERIRASVEKKSFLQREGLNIHLTMSLGVALFPNHADSKKAIVEAADRAMYASKKSTRNAVTIASARALKKSGA